MSFLLDTNILSEHLRRPAGLAHRFIQHSGRLYTSSISLAELYDWAKGRKDPAPTIVAIRDLLTYEVSVIPFDADCAEEFGRLSAISGAGGSASITWIYSSGPRRSSTI